LGDVSVAEVARKETTESNVEKVKLLLSEVTVSQKTKVDVMMFCVTVKRRNLIGLFVAARKSHRSRGIGIALLPARSVFLLHDECAMR